MNEVICIDKSVFRALVTEICAHIDNKFLLPRESKWVNTETALAILNLKSRTSLQAIRDSGQIRFSQPSAKQILYDRDSLISFIESHAHETF